MGRRACTEPHCLYKGALYFTYRISDAMCEVSYKPLSDFPHLSKPDLGPTQPPVQWVPGLSRGKERPGRDADPSPPSSAVVKEG